MDTGFVIGSVMVQDRNEDHWPHEAEKKNQQYDRQQPIRRTH
jgi:hypothetical protein